VENKGCKKQQDHNSKAEDQEMFQGQSRLRE
jgi:hypothetical protein